MQTPIRLHSSAQTIITSEEKIVYPCCMPALAGVNSLVVAPVIARMNTILGRRCRAALDQDTVNVLSLALRLEVQRHQRDFNAAVPEALRGIALRAGESALIVDGWIFDKRWPSDGRYIECPHTTHH